MGSGISTSPRSASQSEIDARGNGDPSQKKQKDRYGNQLVRTNEVAPVIIMNCREEFQHISEFKDPVVVGSIADNMPEHPLLKGRYFLVRDPIEAVDKLKSADKYSAANVFQAGNGLPVYGCGQPTKKGLNLLIDGILKEGYQKLCLINLREEPVFYVKEGNDYVPYSIRDQDDLSECVVTGKSVQEADEFESRLRREIINLTEMDKENVFRVYSKIDSFDNEPHVITVQCEDYLPVSEDIYSEHTFASPTLRYRRLCFPVNKFPKEECIDEFLSIFKESPDFFERKTHMPAMLFNCQTGIERTTLGMVLGNLLLGHKQGFTNLGSRSPPKMNEKEPNYRKGEYGAIQRLIHALPDGLITKYQVDHTIDNCSEVINLRTAIFEAKNSLESITYNFTTRETNITRKPRKKCIDLLDIYFWLICFNAYLREQFPVMLCSSFLGWMLNHPELYRIRANLDVSEKTVPVDLLSTGERILVADEYIGLDMLSTQMEVMVSNFRRVPGFPVYGMAQPTKDGFTKVINSLIGKKKPVEKIVIVSLRNDQVLECDGMTYSVREATATDEPVIIPAMTAREIEDRDEKVKEEVMSRKMHQVIHQLEDPPLCKEFTNVRTIKDICGVQETKSPEISYHRVPMSHTWSTEEKEFDQIMRIVKENAKFKDKDATAFLYSCRTGKSRTTFAMSIACLISSHIHNIPAGSNPEDEERISLPNAQYTKGNFLIVQKLVRLLPNGQRIKREVDFVLDQCFESMTTMHFHLREEIFVTYNKIKKQKAEAEKIPLRQQCYSLLEKYIYLILFNAYLHVEKKNNWKRPFSLWMKEAASKNGVYDLLNNLGFYDFEPASTNLKSLRERWQTPVSDLPFRGAFT